MSQAIIPAAAAAVCTLISGLFYLLIRRHIGRVDRYFQAVDGHETRLAVIEDRCGIERPRDRVCVAAEDAL